MNYRVKTVCLRLALLLCTAVLFQGCALYPPRTTVHYPPPQPVVKKQPMKPPVASVPTHQPVPRMQVPKQSRVATDFSRQAAEKSRQGNYDLAASILERGLRVAPKDAMLWSQLAEVKLQQRQYQQARSLAAKSNSLAGANRAVVGKNHWIIQEAQKRASGQ